MWRSSENRIYILAYNLYNYKQKCKLGGGYMIPSQQILKLAKDNNGVITTAMIANAGLPRRHTSRWADFGEVRINTEGKSVCVCHP